MERRTLRFRPWQALKRLAAAGLRRWQLIADMNACTLNPAFSSSARHFAELMPYHGNSVKVFRNSGSNRGI